MLTHLHLQGTLDDDIALLPFMGGQLDILLLRFRAVGRLHIQGLRDPVAEGSRHVVIDHVVGFLNALAFAPPGNGKGVQVRAGTLDDVSDVDAEGQGAAVQEREVQVRPAHFAVDVFLLGDARLVRHFGDRKVLDLPQLPDPVSHLLDLIIQSRHLRHGSSLHCDLHGNKNSSQIALRRVQIKYPRYHSNCGLLRHSWTPSGPLPLRGWFGKALLARLLSSFRLGSDSDQVLPAARTTRRVSYAET